MKPRPKIPLKRLRDFQERYDVEAEPKLEHVRGLGNRPGYLTPRQLFDICQWKSKRRPELALRNERSFVKEVTSFSFRTSSEAARISSLTLLEGVSYPTASVVLHFCLDDTYPILDFRALWSLGVKQPKQYSALFWEEYVECCRRFARTHGMTVRELDMALWQYSKENQRA